MANLTPVGVQAVVEGLSAFTGALGQMDKAMQNTGNKASSIGSQFVGLGDGVLKVGAVAAGAALAGITALTAGTIAFGASAIQSASDVAEMQSLFNIVFKQEAAGAREELDAFSASVGRNKYEVQGFAGAIGALLGPMGLTQEQTKGMSVDFAKLAVDLSSFFNVTESDALLALKSGLVGESEPLRKFGVNLSEATINQEAFNLGLSDGKRQLTSAEKAQAIYSIVMRQTAQAQGDAARTSGGWANQMRALTATIDEMKTGIGMQLLPVVTPLLKEFSAMARNVLPQLAGVFTGLVIPAIQKIADLLSTLQAGGIGGLANALGISPEVQGFVAMLAAGLVDLAGVIQGALMQAFTWLSANALPMLNQAIIFVIQNWDAFRGALIGIGAVLAGAAIVGAIAAVGAAIAGLASPIGLIIAAAALLGAAWNTNFLGIRDALTAFWAVAQPIAAEFVAWYGGQMVAGIQQLTAIWNSVLLPAFQAAGAFIQSSVIPAIQQVYTWLATNLPSAIQAASGYWNGVLLPAMQAVGNWINAYLVPAFTALGNFLGAVLNVAVTAAAGLWQNVLYPALLTVYNFLSAQLTPALTTTSTTISGVLGPTVQLFVSGALVAFQQGLQGIQDALAWVTQKLNELSSGLNSVQLPDWLKPGSPTPFEIGLRGIAEALEGKVAKALEGFSATAPATFKALADSVSQIKGDLAAMAEDTLVTFGEAMNSAGGAMVSNFNEADASAGNLTESVADLRGYLSSVAGYAQTAGSSFNSFNDAGNNIYGTLIPALQSLVDWLGQVTAAAEEAAAGVGSVGSASEGAGGPGFQAGANFVVPGGFQRDTFPFRASTGERVIVIPKAQAAAGGGASVTVNFGDVTVANGMDLGELGMFVERAVVQALGA